VADLKKRIYLDWAATAPIDDSAIASAAQATRVWANPSSIHHEGRAANAMLEDTRHALLRAFGGTGTLIFTSGASEAIAIALTRARPGARLISAVEHRAVSVATRTAGVVPVDREGRIDLDSLAAMLARSEGAALVAVMQANNETGVVQPLAQVAAIVRAAGGLLLVDAVQAVGKLDWPDADFVAVSAHKLGGPPGIGALIVRNPATLVGVGAGQELGYRAGTQNLPAAVGWVSAWEARAADPGWTARVATLRGRLEARLIAAGGTIAGYAAERLPNITCVAMPGVEAMRQLMIFDLEGFAVSAGSACSSGRVSASHVLEAMRWGVLASEAIRVSLGWGTIEADVDSFAGAWESAAGRLTRRRAA
jgi:cysteine desulfurase